MSTAMPTESPVAPAVDPGSAADALAAELRDEIVGDDGDTRERILDLARDILLRRSFHSFSYQDLADGVSPALAVHRTVRVMRETEPTAPRLWSSVVHFGP